MKTKALFVLVLGFTLLLGGITPSPLQRADVQRDLDALTKRGFTYRVLSNGLVELRESHTGTTQIFALQGPSEGAIRSWATARGIPILEIDPALIDTTQYVGWYNYWQRVPISGSPGKPLVVADVDGNGNSEIYGIVAVGGPITTIESRICEVNPPFSTFRHTYQPYPGIPTGIVDVDRDGLK